MEAPGVVRGTLSIFIADANVLIDYLNADIAALGLFAMCSAFCSDDVAVLARDFDFDGGLLTRDPRGLRAPQDAPADRSRKLAVCIMLEVQYALYGWA